MNKIMPFNSCIVSTQGNEVKIQKVPAIKCMSIVEMARGSLKDWSAIAENIEIEDMLTVTLCFSNQDSASRAAQKIQKHFLLESK